LSQKSCFWDFWTLYVCLFVAKIVYSDSARGELSFGTKTGSVGPCVPILWPNLGLRADLGPFFGLILGVFGPVKPQIVLKSALMWLFVESIIVASK
jgi:hypothetical protein